MIKLIWFARLGNSIIQLMNVLHIALYYKYRIKLPEHAFFDTNYLEKQFDDYRSNNNVILEGIFFYRQRINDIHTEVFDVNHDKVIDILRKAFIVKDVDRLDKNDIVLHIRGGDIFIKPHPNYIQPPLSYYVDILDNHNLNRVIVVAEDERNSVLNQLLKTVPNIIYRKRTLIDIFAKKQALKRDIKTIMGASQVVSSFGSFIPYLLLLSSNIEQLYQTSYQSLNMDEVVGIEYEKYNIGNFKIHNIDLAEYRSLITPWKNTKEQREILLNYKM